MGQNRTDFELKQRIAALPPIVRAQLTEILEEMMSGSTQRAFSASALTGPLTGSVTGNVTGNLTGTHTGNALLGSTVYTPQTITASEAITDDATVVLLNKADGALAVTMPVAGATVGQHLIVTQIDAGTSGHTLTLAGATFDGTNNTATFDAAGETLELLGITGTRYLILQNIGAVALSNVA